MKSIKKIQSIKPIKNESEIESLARIVQNGFAEMQNNFVELKNNVDKRFDEIDKRFDSVDKRFDGIDTQVSSLFQEQKETNRRLDSIERKQVGMLTNLDETVHRKEFAVLLRRVDILEKKVVRK